MTCPAGWIASEFGSCYQMTELTSFSSIEDVVSHCKNDLGAEVFTPNSDQETQFVISTIMTVSSF